MSDASSGSSFGSAAGPLGAAYQPRTEHAAENQRLWDEMAADWVAAGERSWASDEPAWGNWQVPDAEVRLLPDDLSGLRAVELGCGTGYVSAWMARRGASVYAVDNSPGQLATARRLAAEHGLDRDITFVLGDAERVPQPDASFDFAVSEYGAAIWCDPYGWIPEAARLLRPGGRLAFLGNHPLSMICAPADGGPIDRTLHRPWFDLHRLDWTQCEIDPGGIEFNLPFSKWLRLFDDTGFDVDDYVEIQVPEGATTAHPYVSAEWAHRWPAEQAWKLTRR